MSIELEQSNREFVEQIQIKLAAGKSPAKIARELGVNHSTMINRIHRLGYEIELTRRIVPKRAPKI
jgi:transposase-like protein